MPKFSYTAVDANTGRERRGSIHGESERDATAQLKELGLFPTQMAVETAAVAVVESSSKRISAAPVTPAEQRPVTPSLPTTAVKPRPDRNRQKPAVVGGRKWLGRRGVGAKGLTLFTRQLATLVKAGMPILRGLEVLARQQKPGPFQDVITGIAEAIRSGGNLSDGLAQHPKIFDRLYVNMVRAGEASGALDVVLARLAEFLEKSQKIRGKVQSAMTYPLIIMLVACGVVGALMIFVIPRFESIFNNMLKGQALPALTAAVVSVSRFVQDHFLISAGLIVGLVVVLRWAVSTAAGGRIWDRFSLASPILGDLVLKASVARFTRTQGTLLASGVQILPALQITRDTAGNVHIAEAIDAVQERVKAGEGVARPLEATGIFPGMVSSMIEVGEETGKLPEMLERIAETYDEEVDNAVAALTSVLEPIMIVLMALVVGTIVIALFLPLVRIVQSLS